MSEGSCSHPCTTAHLWTRKICAFFASRSHNKIVKSHFFWESCFGLHCLSSGTSAAEETGRENNVTSVDAVVEICPSMQHSSSPAAIVCCFNFSLKRYRGLRCPKKQKEDQETPLNVYVCLVLWRFPSLRSDHCKQTWKQHNLRCSLKVGSFLRSRCYSSVSNNTH